MVQDPLEIDPKLALVQSTLSHFAAFVCPFCPKERLLFIYFILFFYECPKERLRT